MCTGYRWGEPHSFIFLQRASEGSRTIGWEWHWCEGSQHDYPPHNWVNSGASYHWQKSTEVGFLIVEDDASKVERTKESSVILGCNALCALFQGGLQGSEGWNLVEKTLELEQSTPDASTLLVMSDDEIISSSNRTQDRMQKRGPRSTAWDGCAGGDSPLRRVILMKTNLTIMMAASMSVEIWNNCGQPVFRTEDNQPRDCCSVCGRGGWSIRDLCSRHGWCDKSQQRANSWNRGRGFVGSGK